jgi:hypothetical protein
MRLTIVIGDWSLGVYIIIERVRRTKVDKSERVHCKQQINNRHSQVTNTDHNS